MSSHQPEKIGPYFFIKTTFHLLNLELYPSFQTNTPTIVSVSHLSRFLTSKMGALKTSQILHPIHPSKRQIDSISGQQQSEWKGMDEISVRIRDQLSKVKSLMRETQIKNKHKLKNKNTWEEQKFKQMMQSEGTISKAEHLCAYFQQLGQYNAGKLAKELQLYGESCESYQDLLQTFRHIIFDDQPPSLFTNKMRDEKKFKLNIHQYGELFQQILRIKQKRVNKRQIFLDDYLGVKFPKSIQKNQYYKIIENELKMTLKQQKSVENKYIFSDIQGLIRFVEMQPVVERRYEENGPLTYQLLWDKLDDLIRRGPVYHDMIGIHLLQFNENQLYNFFKATLSGKIQPFMKNLILYESNNHYRNFVQIVARKYSEQLIRQNKPLSKVEIAGVIKELILRLNLKQNLQNPLKLIKQYTTRLSEKLRFKLKKIRSCNQVTNEIRQLIYLGEVATLIKTLVESQKINTIEALFILIRFINVNLDSSEILLFNSQSIIDLYSTFLQKTIKNEGNEGQMSLRQIVMFLKVFLPFLPFEKMPSPQHLKDTLTYNKSLLEYIIQNQKSSQCFEYFNLGFDHFSQILQTSMLKHSNYAYCLEIALSIFIPLSYYIQLCYPKSRSKSKSYKQSTLNYFSDEFHCKRLQRLEFGKNFTFSQRFKLLITIMKHFQKVNVQLSKNRLKRQNFYDQVSFCNEMLSHLSKKGTTQILWRNSHHTKNQIKQNEDQLLTQIMHLTFTFNLLKIRQFIVKSKFEEMVELFNQFLEKIAPHFHNILAGLQKLLKEDQAKKLGLNYLRQLTQGLLVLKSNKVKVITKNRYLFKVLCSNISQLLKGIKDADREDAQLIEEQLKQTANQIISL